MSLKPEPVPPVPEEAARSAHGAFPPATVAMRLRDTICLLSTDDNFIDRSPTHGQPAEAPWRLALVSVLQCTDGLLDRQAADAVRGQIEWTYALSLPLDDADIEAGPLNGATRDRRASQRALSHAGIRLLRPGPEAAASGGAAPGKAAPFRPHPPHRAARRSAAPPACADINRRCDAARPA